MSSSTNFDYDRRTLPTSAAYGTATCGNNQTPPIYSTLSIPRAAGDTIFAKLQGWTDAEVANRQKLMAQAQDTSQVALVFVAIALTGFVCYVTLRLAEPIQRRLGTTGIHILGRAQDRGGVVSFGSETSGGIRHVVADR